MTLKNPFSDYGGIINSDRFVGRKTEQNQIQKRLLGETYGNLAIMGIPRIGKSSLAWNAIIENKETLIQKKILPVWVPLGEFSNLIELMDEVISNCIELIEQLKVESIAVTKLIQNSFIEASSSLEKRRFIKKFMRNLNLNGFRLILIIDEFDNAAEIFNLQDFQFLREISYNLETKIGIVTISRKTIQELEPDNGALSNFYQIFDELRLKLFSDEDLLLYWQRLNKLGLKVSESFKDNVIFYSGKHPYLLDLINYNIFNKIEQTDINLDEIFNNTLEDLKLKLYNEYESILKLMKQENLDNKLVQMIVGPVYDITKRDVEKLLKYSLVKSTSDESFECFAKFFEEYLSLKSSEIHIWPLWSSVEEEIRNIIKIQLVEKYGENWEAGYRKEFGKNDDLIVDILDGNKYSAGLIKERERSIRSFGSLASNNLIDYTLPRQMFDYFLSRDWPWYQKIFIKQKSDWKTAFDHLSKIRNPLAHNNPYFLTESDKNLAQGYCQEILELIKKWRQSISIV